MYVLVKYFNLVLICIRKPLYANVLRLSATFFTSWMDSLSASMMSLLPHFSAARSHCALTSWSVMDSRSATCAMPTTRRVIFAPANPNESTRTSRKYLLCAAFRAWRESSVPYTDAGVIPDVPSPTPWESHNSTNRVSNTHQVFTTHSSSHVLLEARSDSVCFSKPSCAKYASKRFARNARLCRTPRVRKTRIRGQSRTWCSWCT